MSVLSLTLTALLSQRSMPLARFSESFDLFRHRCPARAECLDEVHAFRLDRSDRLRSAVHERLGHRWLICTLHSTVETVVCCLECHLNESVGRKSMPGDEVLAVSSKLQCLTVVLTDQVGDPSLGESNAGAEFRCQLPLQFPRRGVDLLFGLLLLSWLSLIALRMWRELGLE